MQDHRQPRRRRHRKVREPSTTCQATALSRSADGTSLYPRIRLWLIKGELVHEHPRVHRANHDESGGEGDSALGPGDCDDAVLERLAGDLEAVLAELEWLAEDEDAAEVADELAQARATGWTSGPSTSAASRASGKGTKALRKPRSAAKLTIGRMPLVWRRPPSRWCSPR